MQHTEITNPGQAGPADASGEDQELLARMREVEQRIEERVREALADPDHHPPLSDEPTKESPPVA